MPNETTLQIGEQSTIQQETTTWKQVAKCVSIIVGTTGLFLLAKTTGLTSWFSSLVTTEDGQDDAMTLANEGQLSAFEQRHLMNENEEILEIFSPEVVKEDGLKLTGFKELTLSERTIHQKRDVLPVSTEGLIAWYPLDSTWGVGDASGNGNNATLMGSPPPFLTTDRFGDPTGAYEIAGNVGEYGSDIYIEIPCCLLNAIPFVPGRDGIENTTINIWVLEKSKTYPERAFYISFGQARSMMDYPIVGIENGNDNLFEGINLVYSNPSTYGIAELVPFVNKTSSDFRFYSFVYDGTNGIVKGYVDGNLTVNIPIPAGHTRVESGYNSAIGKYWVTSSFEYTRINGIFDDVTVFNRTLTDSEIRALYCDKGWCLNSSPTTTVAQSPTITSTVPTTTVTQSPTVTSVVPTTTLIPSVTSSPTPSTTGLTSSPAVTSVTNHTTALSSTHHTSFGTPTVTSGASSVLNSSSSQVSTSVIPPESSSNTPITPSSSGHHTPANNIGIIVGGVAGGIVILAACVGGTLVAVRTVQKRNGYNHSVVTSEESRSSSHDSRKGNGFDDIAEPTEAAKKGCNAKRKVIDVELAEGETAQIQQIDKQEFKIVKKLGEGAFGVVFLGNWDGENVAIKKLHHQYAQDKDVRQSIEKEAAVLSCLRHPGIIQVFGVCQTEYEFRIIMEFASEGSLDSFLSDDSKPFDWNPNRVQIAMDIANALCYVHGQGIWHRDLKSGNVLINRNGNGGGNGSTLRAKLTDFGEAKVLQDKTQKQRATKGVGTLCWMAPEILQGRDYGDKADVYSFAIILWQLAVREDIPYKEEKSQFAISKRVEGGGRPEIPAECDRDFERIITWCWSQDPQERPDMRQIKEELTTYQASVCSPT